MTVTDEDGISYDLTPCLGGTDMPKSWYSQSDMDTIISYARGKGIDVVPSFDMPGHMQWILKYFPAFRYESSNTLNIMNITAVKFAKAISDKYSKYFQVEGAIFGILATMKSQIQMALRHFIMKVIMIKLYLLQRKLLRWCKAMD